jgi:glycosyltransferase involved in cell wall biosynthesis
MDIVQHSPKISIILPLYRVKEWLPQAIASIKAQTYQDFECLCIDDGSPNEMASFARALTQDDARFKVMEFENAGVATTRNRGLDLARGEFVAFIDQDDSYHPRFLECMIRGIESTKSDMISCFYQEVFEDFDVSTFKHHEVTATSEVMASALVKRMTDARLIAVWTKLFRRSSIENLRFNPELFGTDDAAFTCRAFAHLSTVAMLPDALYYYRRQPQAVTQKMPLRYLLSMIAYAVDIYPVLQAKLTKNAKKIFIKILFDALKIARRYAYTREEKLQFIHALKSALKTSRVSLFTWPLGKQLGYWKFRWFLR